MSYAIDPDEQVPYVLAEDRAKPPDRRRTLLVRPRSARAVRTAEQQLEAARNASSTAEMVSAIDGVLRPFVVGGSGFVDDNGNARPVDVTNLDDYLNEADYIELRDSLLDALTLGVMEKKRSALRSPSTAGGSVSQTAEAGA